MTTHSLFRERLWDSQVGHISLLGVTILQRVRPVLIDSCCISMPADTSSCPGYPSFVGSIAVDTDIPCTYVLRNVLGGFASVAET